MGLFSKNTSAAASNDWMAVVSGVRRLDAVAISRPAEGLPVVRLADSFDFDGDLTQTLKRLRGPLGLTRQRCTTLLSHGAYQLIQTEAPEASAGPVSEAADALRWKIKDMVEFDVSDAAIDLLPIPAEGRSPQVFAAIAPASAMIPVVQGFQDAKVPLTAIDLPELSQRNLAALLEDENRGLALLIFDETEGLLTFTYHGELFVVRHIEITAAQLAVQDAERRANLYERVGLDVQRSLDNFDRGYSQIPISKVVVAAVPGAEGFIDYLRSNLALPVEEMVLSAKIDFSKVPALLDPIRLAQCLRAIGAALRLEGGTA